MKEKSNIVDVGREQRKRRTMQSDTIGIYGGIIMRIVSASLLFLLVSASGLFAQSSKTQTRSVSIGVAVGLTAYTDKGLDFGNIVAGAGLRSVAVTDAAAGKVTISGQWNKMVYVTLTPPSSLVNGSNSIAYTPGAAYNNTADDPTTATVWSSPTGAQAGFRLHANRSGQVASAFIYIYGSISVGSIAPGAYSGTYVLNITY